MVAVLEVAAGNPDLAQGGDEVRGLHPVSRLGVDRGRHRDASRDPRRGGEHLRTRGTFMVLVAERGGDAGAGRRDDRKARCLDRPRGGNVPGIRQQQWLASNV